MLNKTSNNGSVDDRIFYLDRSRVTSAELDRLLAQNATRNTTQNDAENFSHNGNSTGNYTFLCGFPSFCSANGDAICPDTPLKECSDCDMIKAGIFAAVLAFVGCMILAGNGMVIWNVVRKRKGFDDTYSKIRGSLAAADILTGVQIFAVVLYNFSWTINSSVREIDQDQQALRGSPGAVAGGIFYLLGFTSSLYHLMFLSGQRLFAIAMPFRYKVQSKRTVYASLIALWLLAFTSATIPVWFPDSIQFTYYHTIFLYFPTYIDTSYQQNYTVAIVMLVLLIFLPYLIMSTFSISSGVLVYSYLKKRATKFPAMRRHSKIANQQSNITKHEVSLFKTVTLMQFGFTVTLVPVCVVTALLYTGQLNCDNYSTPHMICFYLSVSNSLVNVLVYSVLDAKFRASVVDAFGACIPVCCKSKPKRKIELGGKDSAGKTISTYLTQSSLFKSLESIHLKFNSAK